MGLKVLVMVFWTASVPLAHEARETRAVRKRMNMPSDHLSQDGSIGQQSRLGAWADDEGALVFLEHGGAVDIDAWFECIAVPHPGRQHLAGIGKEHRPRALERRSPWMTRQFQRAAAAGHRRAGRQTQSDELDGSARCRPAKQPPLRHLEPPL